MNQTMTSTTAQSKTRDSLIKYDPPVLVADKDTKKAAPVKKSGAKLPPVSDPSSFKPASQIDEILAAIIPPK
jgi:hypothetical protein